MLIVADIKAIYLKISINQVTNTCYPGIMFAVFVMNILGNLLSGNRFEKKVFIPVSPILSMFSFWLAIIKVKTY